ncbi:expressed unknown protein [Ectocarpus siliculosus]|uniref:Bifunctional lysine-specific demethylase and histidyl-hydroxylase n=1 Tax=Ectocarpus siliculosus TaxID=2880 RepID=D7FPB9_ECTSI|nr:expressed unknown protein [Ectocarpus siliculosus]|eukprot:CBJ30378.1 expressed unknown protein [Ectocarpus siliculosus]
MAKDKGAVESARGGSRAAKKRRKQKGKASASGGSTQPTASSPSGSNPVPPSKPGSSRDDTRLATAAGSAKRKRKSITAATSNSAGQPPVASGNGAATGGGSSNGDGDGAGSGSGSSRRSGHQKPARTTIDASAADDRSRLLLELDAQGVLSDPDVESGLKARQLLQWIIAPLSVEEFYGTYWERNPFVVRGRRADYFSGWLETSDLEAFISGQSMQYGTDLDVTNYVNKRRVTLNPAAPAPPPEQSPSPPPKKGGHKGKGKGGPSTSGNGASGDAHLAATGRAGGAVVTPKFVWQKFREGCSLRMPCPQKFSDPLHLLLSALEEEFGCMVGSNVYLTPPRSQGFAPHWDDIEAFLLQVEGRKRWRVYPPTDDQAVLPRLSSPNLTDEQVGEPALEVVLEPGDLLYLPRGWAHQAETVGDEASLHITVSAMQGNCWADLVEGLVPQAVASAVQANQELRSGLPRDYLEYMGVVHSDEEDKRRDMFKAKMRKKLGLIVEEAIELLDAAADQMGKRYISDRLPPVLEESEELSSVVERGDGAITPLTKLRLARRGCARLVLEDGVAVVYHCMDNSRVHHGNAMSPLQFELDDAPALEVLLSAYPRPVTVSDLPHPPTEDLEDKVGIAAALFKESFMLIVDDAEDDDDADGGDGDGGGESSSDKQGTGNGAGSLQQMEEEEEEDEDGDGL